jgi:ABC-2 type transport system permease protein
MSTTANAMPDLPASQITAPRPISEGQRLYWSVRREVWEHRYLYVAPLAVSAVFLLGFLIGAVHLPAKMRAALAFDPMQLHELIEKPYDFAALLIMGTTFIVGIFYCLDALHGERRDRSILFWKSLPVSDLTTVLSKASILFVVLPLVTFAITVALQSAMLLLGTMILLGSGLSVASYWQHVALLQTSVMLLYHLLAIHSLWWAPLWGWLLLVSAWSRRVPLLWATVPLLAIAIVEKIAFNTSHLVAMLVSRFLGSPGGTRSSGHGMSMASLTPALGQFLSSPGLWIGLAVCAAFLAAAVRLRRYREPM